MPPPGRRSWRRPRHTARRSTTTPSCRRTPILRIPGRRQGLRLLQSCSTRGVLLSVRPRTVRTHVLSEDRHDPRNARSLRVCTPKREGGLSTALPTQAARKYGAEPLSADLEAHRGELGSTPLGVHGNRRGATCRPALP